MFDSLSHFRKEFPFFWTAEWRKWCSDSADERRQTECLSRQDQLAQAKIHHNKWKLGVIFLQGFNFLESCWKEGFNFVSHLFEKGFNSWCHILEKGFNSLSHFRKRGSILWVTLEIKGSTFGQRNEGSDAVTVRMNEGKKVLVATGSTGSRKDTSQQMETGRDAWKQQKLANPFGCRRHHSGQILTFWESRPLENSAWIESTLFFQYQEKCWTHDCASVDTTQVNISADVDVIHYDAEKKHRFRKNSILWVMFKKKRFNSVRFFFFLQKKKCVQFFESYWTKGFNLWVVFLKTGSILWVIKRAQFCESRKQGSTLWVTFEKKAQFFESHSRKVQFFESYSKGWVIFKKVQFCESHRKEKSVQYFESFKKGSILWVFFLKKRFNSLKHIFQKGDNSLSHVEKRWQFCDSYLKEEETILWDIFKKVFNPLIHIQFFEFFFLKKNLSHIQKKFYSLSRIQQKGSILWVILKKVWVMWKKSSILCVLYSVKSWFNSVCRIKKGILKNSILWVILKKVQFFDSFFLQKAYSQKKINSLSHIQEKRFNSLRHVQEKKVQFSASYSRTKGSILCVIFKNKRINSLRHIEEKKVQFFESYWKMGSILWVISRRVQFFESFLKKRCSILWVIFL